MASWLFTVTLRPWSQESGYFLTSYLFLQESAFSPHETSVSTHRNRTFLILGIRIHDWNWILSNSITYAASACPDSWGRDLSSFCGRNPVQGVTIQMEPLWQIFNLVPIFLWILQPKIWFFLVNFSLATIRSEKGSLEIVSRYTTHVSDRNICHLWKITNKSSSSTTV